MTETAKYVNVDDLDPYRIREVGNWTEQISSSGKRYFYNRETEVSQWDKPMEWIETERRHEEEQRMREEETQRGGDNERREGGGCDSEAANASSPEAMDISLEGVQDDEEKEKKEEEEPGMEWKKYYNKNAVTSALTKTIFGEEDTAAQNGSDTSISFFKQQTISRYEYHLKMLETRLNMHKAQSISRTTWARGEYYGRKAEHFEKLQKEMEEKRAHFQANFSTEMPRLLEQCRPAAADVSTGSKERKRDEHGRNSKEKRDRPSSSRHPSTSERKYK